MTPAAFIGIALIHLAAAISPGPSFVVAVRTAAAEGLRPAVGLAIGLGLAAAIRLGMATQFANPKPAVFFGAVFIGLVPPETPVWVLAALLTVICVQETLWYVLVARVFSLARSRAAYGRFKATVDRTFGGLIALLGAKIVTT